MRLVIIEKIPYAEFERYRDECLEKGPQGLISANYSKRLEKATFWFWDADYVPASTPGGESVIKRQKRERFAWRVAPIHDFVEQCIQVTAGLAEKFDDYGFQCLVFGYVVGRQQLLRTSKPLHRILDHYYHLWDEHPELATRFLLNALTGYARGRRWGVR
jgi:hypothetical protein